MATTRSPAPTANSVSVTAGVSETIFWGVGASVMAVPSSSVTVTGKAGAGDGLAVGVGATWRSAAAVGTTPAALGDGDEVAAPAHAASEQGEDDEQGEERAGGRDRADGTGWHRAGTSGVGVGGVATNRETPRFERVERGV